VGGGSLVNAGVKMVVRGPPARTGQLEHKARRGALDHGRKC
jgi:hypothetical protein